MLHEAEVTIRGKPKTGTYASTTGDRKKSFIAVQNQQAKAGTFQKKIVDIENKLTADYRKLVP